MRSAFLTIVVIMTLIMVACSRNPKGPAIVVFDSSGEVKIFGTVQFTMNINTSSMEPNIWKEGNLFLFRTPQTLSDGFQARGGAIYRVDKDRNLKEVGTFDVKKTDEELKQLYVE